MKYLIVKGALGFGDRLQSLKMCVAYALKHNLQIYVDWTDSIWSHNGESFYTYFKLINMPVLKSLDDIPADSTIYPPFWKDKLKENSDILEEYDYPKEVILDYITDQVFDADVLVFLCWGKRFRYPVHTTFFTNVFRVIDDRILQKVLHRQRVYDLKNVIGVHLRGTDKGMIDKQHRMAGLNIRMVGAGMLNGTKFVAVSDDAEFVKLWKSRFSSFPVLTDESILGSTQGLHLKSASELTVSKDQSNVDLLVDFFTLASCINIISTFDDSRFAQEALRMHNGLSQVLNI
jgi:hypothetical protein